MTCRWVLQTVLSLAALAVLSGAPARAQDDQNCKDFANQPEAQASLNSSYPDDPDRLDSDKDWIACEEFFKLTDAEAARVVPADRVNNSGQSSPEPAPASIADDAAPAPSPASAPAAPPAALTSTSSRIDPPADLMAQVASCEVVAVSSRSIAAAGCPGVGTIVLRPPAGTPRMRSQVIIRPGAALRPATDRVATAAQTAIHDDDAGKRGRDARERPRKKRHQSTEQAARSAK